jgi:hypothetical protein
MWNGLGNDSVSHFQLLQNALRRKAKLLYCAFDLMFQNGEDLQALQLIERKKRLKTLRLWSNGVVLLSLSTGGNARAATDTAKQQCMNICRGYRDCRHLKQLPSLECRGILTRTAPDTTVLV